MTFLLVAGSPPADDIGFYRITMLLAGVAGWPLAVCSCWWTLRARAHPDAPEAVGLLSILLPVLYALFSYCFYHVTTLASNIARPYGQVSKGAAGLLLDDGWGAGCVLVNLIAIVGAALLACRVAPVVAQLAGDLPD